jgi:hypothetical protein
MSSDGNVIQIDRRRKITYSNDPIGTLQQAIDCARANDVASVVVAMIDDDGEEYYILSDETTDTAMLGALEVIKSIIIDDLRDSDE